MKLIKRRRARLKGEGRKSDAIVYSRLILGASCEVCRLGKSVAEEIDYYCPKATSVDSSQNLIIEMESAA